MLLDTRQWPAGKGNRLAVWQEHRYAYDHWGNCTDKRSGPHRHLHMQWDAAHQLSAVRIDDARTQESKYWAYAYDPFGRRIAKWQTNQAGQRPVPEAITHFSWDGNRLLTEQQLCRTPDQSEPQLHHTLYVYEPDSFVPLAQVQTVRAPDDPDTILPDPEEASLQQQYPDIWAANVLPLQRRIAARLKNTLPKAPEVPASTTQILYYHTDHLGTPRELTNAEGHIVWEARYKAWGRVHQIDYPAVPHTIVDGNTQRQVWIEIPHEERPVQNLRFQGQYHDEETGLHYNRFRYYDPDVGRFASQDPIGLAGGMNTYQYAPNPVSWIDPLGLSCCTGGVADGAVKFKRWKPGEAIDKPMPDGSAPSWDVVRSRYWKNRASASSGDFSRENLARMRQGKAPLDYNPRTNIFESRELHHVVPQRAGGSNGPINLRELTPDQHGAVDPFRHTVPTTRGIR